MGALQEEIPSREIYFSGSKGSLLTGDPDPKGDFELMPLGLDKVQVFVITKLQLYLLFDKRKYKSNF